MIIRLYQLLSYNIYMSESLKPEQTIQIDDTPENIFFFDAIHNSSAIVIEKENSTTKIIRTTESEIYVGNSGDLILRRFKDPVELSGIVQSTNSFEELLLSIDNWTCGSVSRKHAKAISMDLNRKLNREVTYLTCGTYVCSQIPPYELRNPGAVRYATVDDIDSILAVAKVDKDFASFTPHRLEEFISQNFIVCAFDAAGKPTTIVSAEAVTPKYVMNMYYTPEEHRGKSYATDGHYLLLKQIVQSGRSGVTSIADANIASIKTSTKLGYQKIEGDEEYFIIGNPPYRVS